MGIWRSTSARDFRCGCSKAFSKIWRCSASALIPCWLARFLRALTMASSILRTIKSAIDDIRLRVVLYSQPFK
ncbi:unknown protein [Microcystis aeruginosa NIES-843]|uniref:Uncharacterized protein n=1 Tax=Microcystis aeruginosa (strain NIES-843 / IAM M-2473) TaxID=449447 RepID=B0JSH0_MICAN|nr:unknown protein [Microcystis aeruginosa NIES-843]